MMKPNAKQLILAASLWLCLLAPLHGGQERKAENSPDDLTFCSTTERSLALNYYAFQALQTTGEEHKKYLVLFFRALPRDFRGFFHLIYCNNFCFARDGNFYTDHFENWEFRPNPWGDFFPNQQPLHLRKELPPEPTSGEFPVLKRRFYDYRLFGHQTYTYQGKELRREKRILAEIRDIVPPAVFYEKLIAIGLGGFWGMEEIDDLQGWLQNMYIENEPLAVRILEKKTDDEIAGFFFFLLDSSIRRRDTYDEKMVTAYESTAYPLSPRVAKLARVAIERLAIERPPMGPLDCCCGEAQRAKEGHAHEEEEEQATGTQEPLAEEEEPKEQAAEEPVQEAVALPEDLPLIFLRAERRGAIERMVEGWGIGQPTNQNHHHTNP